jgi:hypothetical protein
MNRIITGKVSGIYKITNIKNGKIYIGSSNDMGRRCIGHATMLNGNKHDNIHLQRAWNRDGESSFEFSIIELCFPFSLISREQYWIDELKPEYNLAPIAGSLANFWTGRKLSEEHKRNIGLGNKGKIGPMRGKRHSPEAIEKMRTAALNRTDEVKLKNVTSHKGKPNGLLGKKATKEHRENISKGNKGKPKSLAHRLALSVAQKLRWKKAE